MPNVIDDIAKLRRAFDTLANKCFLLEDVIHKNHAENTAAVQGLTNEIQYLKQCMDNDTVEGVPPHVDSLQID
jgi:hypothetical protein